MMKKSGAPRCIDNIFQVIKLFNSNSSVTSKMIADTLGISRRSAQRYITDISAHLGVVQNDDGSYYCMDVSKIKSDFFNRDDKILLYTLVEKGKSFIPAEKHPVLDKLKHYFMLESASDTVSVVYDNSIDYTIISERVKSLETAIKYKNRITFHYSRSAKEHTVSPYKIIQSGGYWYLYSLYEGKQRIFRIDYIENLKDEPEKVEDIPQEYICELNRMNSIWGMGGKNITVDIMLDMGIASFFLNRTIFTDMVVISENPCIIRVNIAHEMELYEKLAQFTPYYEVLNEPARSFFYQNLSEGSEIHKKPDQHDTE